MPNCTQNSKTFYTSDTSDDLIKVLEELINTGEKVSITFGNIATGKPWTDPPDSGYVGQSSDAVSLPILLKSKFSQTGEPILTNSIIKITGKAGKVLYQGPIH